MTSLDKMATRMKIAVRLSVFVDNYVHTQLRDEAIKALVEIVEMNNQMTLEESKRALQDAVDLIRRDPSDRQP